MERMQVGERQECAEDVANILRGERPRRVGEDPVNMGLFERIAPSKLLQQFSKLQTVASRPASGR